jgi:hypothetical protein
MESNYNRREILRLTAVVGAGMALGGCSKGGGARADEKKELGKAEGGEPGEEETAVEDLMCEHGVLRRALLVYTAAVSKLRSNAAAVALRSRPGDLRSITTRQSLAA